MNIYDIKAKAKSVLANRDNVMGVFIFISVLTTVVTFLAQLSPILGMVLLILMLPFPHGYVVTALKVVNEYGDDVSIENEGLTGFKRYKELFFTYFIQELFLFIIIILISLVFFLFAKLFVSDSVVNGIEALLMQASLNSTGIDAYFGNLIVNQTFLTFGLGLFLWLFVILGAAVIYSLVFALTPFVLEKYKITGAKAMSESARLMKGHKKTLFLLQLSYVGWYLLVILIVGIIQVIIPSSLITDLIMAVLMAYLVTSRMKTCIAVMFEEIDLEDKNII